MSPSDAHPTRKRQLAVAGLILAAGAVGALTVRFSGEKTTSTLGEVDRGGPPVVVAVARDVPLRAPVAVAGRLAARRAVDLAPEIAGRLVEVLADIGDVVREGDAAFRLDDRDARLRVDNLEARLAAAEARRRQSRRRVERRRKLGAEGISAPEDVEQAELDDQVAEADLVVTRQDLRLARRALEKTSVTAPWTGTVVARHADPGTWLVPGQAVLRLVDLGRVEVRVDLPASDVVHLRAGDQARVLFFALPGESFDGRIRSIAGEASDADLQFPIAVELAPDRRFGAGMIAEVELDLGRAGRGVAVPGDALDGDSDGALVWLLEGDRVFRRRVVPAGSRAGDVILSSGPAPGDRVVVTSSARLEDGLAVAPQARKRTAGGGSPSAPP